MHGGIARCNITTHDDGEEACSTPLMVASPWEGYEIDSKDEIDFA